MSSRLVPTMLLLVLAVVIYLQGSAPECATAIAPKPKSAFSPSLETVSYQFDTQGARELIAQNPTDSQKGAFLLTIFLRHDQSKTLDEIEQQLKRTGFREKFPPSGVEVLSWYVMMGIGQVVTLRVPPEKLREVNLAIERGAWGAFRTEFYPTYDYKPIWQEQKTGR